MTKSITEHEIILNEDGELALLLESLDIKIDEHPVLVVSKVDSTAYLNFGSDESLTIEGINPDILGKLCEAKSILVIEVGADDVNRTYKAVVTLLKS
jgi:hypothetical protein